MNTKIRLCLVLATLSIFASMLAISPTYAQAPRGPKLDIVRNRITRSPASQLIEMTLGPPKGSDVWTGNIRPSDIETMAGMGRTISSRAGFHYGRIGFNLRKPPMNDVNYRHALAHLLPKDLIVGTIFKYVVVKVSTMVPPAQSLYHNPNVDPHAYSREEAIEILTNSTNYVQIGGVWKYNKPGNPDLETLRFFTPLETTAPTSYTMGRMFVDECRAIGVMNVDHQPTDFSTYVDAVFNKWDFEMFMVFHSLGRFPTQTYTQMNTINNVLGSANPHGITTPGVIIDDPLTVDVESSDYYSGKVWTSLNPAEIESCAKKFQELIMGGSTTDPLKAPAQNTATNNRTMAIPHITIYSRNLYDIQQQQIRGAVNYFGLGIHNGWTWPSLYWDTLGNERPLHTAEMGPSGLTKKVLIYVQTEIPDATLNPLFSTTVYGVTDILAKLYDGLIAVNPYNHRDENWMADEWSFGAEPGGMYIKFNVTLTDSEGLPIRWQDGTAISMNDLKFAMDFIGPQAIAARPHGGWEIPILWSVMRFYTGSAITGPNQLTCHFSTTSPWYVYTVAGNALTLPPQVWMHDPAGNDWTSTAQIIGYKPSNYPYLVGDCKNRLFGTGPWVLQTSVDDIRRLLNADLWANRKHWKTTAEFQAFISDMFHRSGDVDLSDKIDVTDLGLIGTNMWTTNPEGDVTGPIKPTPGPWPEPKKDGEVNSLDLAIAGKYYGESERIPP